MQIKISRLRDDPPAVLVGVNVPALMVISHHVLGFDLLSMEHFFTRLHFHVVSDSLLAAWAEHHERAKDMLRNGRWNRAFFFELGLLCLFLFHAAPKGETVFCPASVGNGESVRPLR